MEIEKEFKEKATQVLEGFDELRQLQQKHPELEDVFLGFMRDIMGWTFRGEPSPIDGKVRR